MKFFSKKQLVLLGLSSIHSIWMIFLSLLLLNWQFVHWDEGELIQFGPILKKLVLGWEEKPAQNELMFVNVSYDNQLVDYYDSVGFPLGNEKITDRKKLTALLDLLKKADNYQAVLMDIRFDLPSENDLELERAFSTANRVLVSNHLINGKPELPTIDVNYGISDYPVVGGGFFKFQYFYSDSIKTLPILLDEMIGHKNYRMGKYFFREEGKWYYNVFMTDLLVRPYDLFISENHYFYENLGTLLYLDEEAFSAITKNKLIVIGDFEKYDVHTTLLGQMPGPLILLNAYLTLSNGTNRLQLNYVVYIFICYLIISLIIFIPGDPLEEAINRMSGNSKIASSLAGALSFFLLLILIVLSSYLIFDFLLNILWLTFYLYILEKAINRFYYHKKRKELKEESSIPNSP